MSTAIATRTTAPVAMRTNNMDTLTVARMLAESGFFGEVRDAGKALAKILAGQELGIGPIASLMGVYYQQGKVTYSANIMAAAVKKSGRYTYRIRRHDTSICEIEFFARTGEGWESLGVSDFSWQDAETAGLPSGPNKNNWKNYPRNMLFARAMSNGAKWFCADVFGGQTPYTPDEFDGEVIVSEGGDMRPVIEDTGPASPPPPAPDPPQQGGGWTHQAEAKWQAGIKVANEADADIPTKPPADAPREAVVAALEELADNVRTAQARRARSFLESELRDVVGIATEAGSDAFEVPEDLAALSDDDLREMIATVQRAIPSEPAA